METVRHPALFTFFGEVYLWKPSTIPFNSRSSVRCIYGNNPPPRSIHVLQRTVFVETVQHTAQFTLFSEMYQFMETVHHTTQFTFFSELYCGNNPPPCLIYIFQCLPLCTFSPSYLQKGRHRTAFTLHSPLDFRK